MSNKTKVLIIESEAGWGQRVEEELSFLTREEAIQYCRDYNNKYNPPKEVTPSWYMYAKLADDTGFGMLR